jgi:hypothetical protein
MAFRTNFIPFWVHNTSHQLRASRLSATQHEAIHGLNTATKLTLLLSEEERMHLQRLALRTPAAGIMTLEEVAAVIGIEGVRGSSCNGGRNGAPAAAPPMGDAGGENAARILSFCRSAAISDHILIYDLGPSTARLQAKALLRRVLVNEAHDMPEDSDPMDYLHIVPEHSKFICACMECRRVSNAAACDGGYTKHTFNEIGTSSSMISADHITGKTRLRCSKRSSASMRAAVALEEELDTRLVEEDAHNVQATKSFLLDNRSGSETGIAARARRDSKNALEQRISSVACGAECMLTVPIVGKAVRLWGEWYALCSFCACFVRYTPQNRVGVEICCMRCDYRMLNRNEKQPVSAKDAAGASVPKCRFCGKEDLQRTGVKWKLVRSPLDTSGHNSNLPPPLRTVFFCPQHFRSWIPSCLKTMPTRVILSHIVYGARPCYGASPEDDLSMGGPRAKKTQKRKRSKH